MSLQSATRKLLLEFQSRPTVRAGSLITTVFGDAVAPRGGVVWLGSLIRVLAPFGISERLVRTSVFRLAKDGWLSAEQHGRRSFYSLTPEGRERFAQATHRIYAEPLRDWDGKWCLLLLSALDADSKDRVRKETGWLGFGALSANVLAHPTPDMTDLDISLRRLGLDESIVVMAGTTLRGDAALRGLAHSSWKLEDIDARYKTFVLAFRPLFTASRKTKNIAPELAFMVRTLLIQEYRKILLRDPLLPTELLPAGWHGNAAYQLCRNLYRLVFEPAERYLSTAMENVDGPLPPASPLATARFGGLDDAQATKGQMK